MEELRFIYRNAKGEESQPRLVNWVEAGKYIDGFNLVTDKVQTYLKCRVMEYLDGAAAVLSDPFVPPPPKPADDRPPDIVFTGFERKVERPALEKLAAKAGMKVRKDVTQHLDYLCYGPNNDERRNKKIGRARSQGGVYVLSKDEFFALLDTGEIPDHFESPFSTA